MKKEDIYILTILIEFALLLIITDLYKIVYEFTITKLFLYLITIMIYYNLIIKLNSKIGMYELKEEI